MLLIPALVLSVVQVFMTSTVVERSEIPMDIGTTLRSSAYHWASKSSQRSQLINHIGH